VPSHPAANIADRATTPVVPPRPSVNHRYTRRHPITHSEVPWYGCGDIRRRVPSVRPSSSRHSSKVQTTHTATTSSTHRRPIIQHTITAPCHTTPPPPIRCMYGGVPSAAIQHCLPSALLPVSPPYRYPSTAQHGTSTASTRSSGHHRIPVYHNPTHHRSNRSNFAIMCGVAVVVLTDPR